MFVGLARISLQIPGARSLKDRRHVVRSFKERARSRLPISIAEIGDVERLQRATLGACVVSGDSDVCYAVLGKLRSSADTLREAVLLDFASQVISLGREGEKLGAGDFLNVLSENEPHAE